MSLIRINRQPSRGQLHIFALAWLVFFGGWGAAAQFKGAPGLATGLGITAAVVPLVGLFQPAILRWAFVGLSYATFPVGWVVSHVVLAVVYYGVFTPIGLIMRLVRYDPLERRFDRAAKTYWRPRNDPRPSESYFRQH